MGLLSFLSELFGGGGSQKVTWGQAQRGIQTQQTRRNENPIEYLTEEIRSQTDNTFKGRLLTKRAQLYQNNGEHQKAVDDYREAIDIEFGTVPIKPSFDNLYGCARSLQSIGDYVKAIGYYTMAIDARPDSFDAHLGVSQCYEKTGGPDSAARHVAIADALRRRSGTGQTSKGVRLAPPTWQLTPRQSPNPYIEFIYNYPGGPIFFVVTLVGIVVVIVSALVSA
jgi:tetratricopeptide (TPR) repeat protein